LPLPMVGHRRKERSKKKGLPGRRLPMGKISGHATKYQKKGASIMTGSQTGGRGAKSIIGGEGKASSFFSLEKGSPVVGVIQQKNPVLKVIAEAKRMLPEAKSRANGNPQP